MNEPALSIIIPTLNEEHYLPKLLQALSGQTYKDFEVIIVDGKSEDKTRAAAENFKNKLPNLKIVTAPMRGTSSQRNYGASFARGRFLLFLDADVLPADDYLEHFLNLTEKKKADVAVAWLIPESNHKIDRLASPLINYLTLEASLKAAPISTGANMFFRRDIFLSLSGFNEKLKVSEDSDMAARALKKGYRYRVLRQPKIYLSMRRFDKEGRLRYAFKCARLVVLGKLFGHEAAARRVNYQYGHYSK